jgi:LPXTG-motif cell wall-anchored protein
MAPSTLRRAGLRAGLIAVAAAACAVLAPGLAQATDSTTTIPVHASQVPTTAAGFGTHSCDNIPGGASATQDGWVFVLPGNSGAFQSLTLTFKKTDGSTTTVSIPPSGGILTNGTSKAWVQTPKGWTLTAGSAVITGSSPQDYFNITHTCPATGPKPTPSPTKSHCPSPSPSESGPVESASASPSASGSASASSPASGSASASPSTAGAVATSPAANGGSSLPVTGVALTGFVIAGLALVGVGTVLVLARRRRRITS